MLLKELYQIAVEKISASESEGEARARLNILLEDYFGLNKNTLLLNPAFEFLDEELLKWEAAIDRLTNGEPVQHICGKAEFYGLEFEVNSSVLIPRNETEELVDFVVKKLPKGFSGNILDIGTGSGCIAISVAKKFQQAKVSAVDFSEDALGVAKRNAFKHKADIHFEQMDFLNEENWGKLEAVDVLLSNPPYVTYEEWEQLEDEVKDFEPAMALHPPKQESALVFYEKIEKFSVAKLTKNGFLMLEINEHLGSEVQSLFTNASFKNQKLIQDINGKDRFFYAEKA